MVTVKVVDELLQKKSQVIDPDSATSCRGAACALLVSMPNHAATAVPGGWRRHCTLARKQGIRVVREWAGVGFLRHGGPGSVRARASRFREAGNDVVPLSG